MAATVRLVHSLPACARLPCRRDSNAQHTYLDPRTGDPRGRPERPEFSDCEQGSRGMLSLVTGMDMGR